MRAVRDKAGKPAVRLLCGLAILTAIACAAIARAQPVASERYVHWQPLANSAELSQDSVLDITQDADGYIWFATQAGLNRYDGQRGQNGSVRC